MPYAALSSQVSLDKLDKRLHLARGAAAVAGIHGQDQRTEGIRGNLVVGQYLHQPAAGQQRLHAPVRAIEHALAGQADAASSKS